MLKSEGVAEAKRAAADCFPTFPTDVHQYFAWIVMIVAKGLYPTHSYCSLQIVMSVLSCIQSVHNPSYRIASESVESACLSVFRK
jgi:hypothetical protein